MTRAGLALWLALAAACGDDEPDVEVCDNGSDDDGDGFADCRDDDCAGPSCVEQCVDGVDNDGDGSVDCDDPTCDGGCTEQCDDARDNDGDGATDCADDECAGAVPETCADGVDNDCDAAADCLDPDCDGGCPEQCTDNRDNDADGAIDCDDPECDGDSSCPEQCLDGRDNDLDDDTDCADADCDPQCDLDGDGEAQIAGGGTDCDDTRADIFSGATETCNGVDDNCDGLADDDDPNLDLTTRTRYYDDEDLDGYGDVLLGLACDPPPDTAVFSGDCDDLDPARNPGEPEVCGTPDDDCDTLVDDLDPDDLDLTTATEWFEDLDGDGYGDPDHTVFACLPPDGYVDNGDDCHLFDPEIAFESEWWTDADGDGYGTGILGIWACVQPVGTAPEPGDCNDLDAGLHPGALGGGWSSLVAAWQADGNADDGTGTWGTATLLGNVVFVPGRYGDAFQFDGSGDSVETGFSWQDPFTMSLWVSPAVLRQPDAGVCASAPDATSDATFDLRLTNLDEIEVHTNLTDIGAGSVTLGWMHVAVAFDGANVLTWASGVPVSVSAWPAGIPGGAEPDIVALILGTDRAGGVGFAGWLDDVLIFDRALSDAEVAALADGSASCMAL
jgi:hypothetical protein